MRITTNQLIKRSRVVINLKQLVVTHRRLNSVLDILCQHNIYY